VRMGGIVEHQIARAVQALLDRDVQAGRQTVESDRQVDDLQREIESGIVQSLAAGPATPAAIRSFLAALKATAALERIGDYASNIAKRSAKLGDVKIDVPLAALRNMSRLVQDNLRQAIDALEENDADKAAGIWRADKAVDDIYSAFFRELMDSMQSDRRDLTARAHLMFIAKNLERIGDHVTTIAECVYQAVTDAALPDARPKGAGSAAE
jgi:phosphate transport system protein